MMYTDIVATSKEHILLAAHRGCAGGNIPCNTIPAFKAAIDQGADIVEIDVAQSIDKQLFVFHPGMEYPHLRSRRLIRTSNSSAVRRIRYVNCDRVKTDYPVSSLDEVLDLLKDKCYINIDKFWTCMPEIAACVRKHGMEKQVVVKTPAEAKYFDMLEQVAPDLPYMPIIRSKDTCTKELLRRNINLVGVEALFSSDEDEVVSDEYIHWLHSKNLMIWGNSIVYNIKDIIAANHTDDTAICGDKETGWLWYKKKKFDIVQTDWLLMLKQYYAEQGTV